MFAPRNGRDRKSVKGTIGDGTLVSTREKIASRAQPPNKPASTNGCIQPSLPDSRNPVISPPSPTVARAAPAQSTRFASGARLSGTETKHIARTTDAAGRFRKNAQRQEAYCMSHPPRTGQKALVIAVKPDQTPITRPRESSSKEALVKTATPIINIRRRPKESPRAPPARMRADKRIP